MHDGMLLADRMRAVCDLLPPGASVTLPRDWLDEVLREEAFAGGETAAVVQIGVDVMATRLGCSESAVRGYCRRRLIPTARKLGGLGWVAEEPAFEKWRLGRGEAPAPAPAPPRPAQKKSRRLGDYRTQAAAGRRSA